jgi:hypothetical protein
MQMDVLHCKTASGVLKELTVFALVYNLVRMIIGQSTILQHLGVERISFAAALRGLGASSTGIPLGALIVNPLRRRRVEPHVKKRRPEPFPLMIKPWQELRQRLIQQACRSQLHAIRVSANYLYSSAECSRPYDVSVDTIRGHTRPYACCTDSKSGSCRVVATEGAPGAPPGSGLMGAGCFCRSSHLS